jgi:branched-chain amino acid transport system permease protein
MLSEFLQHVINGLAAGTIYALVALGYTMVYGVLKLINFAHGDVMMVGVYFGYAVALALGHEYASSVTGALLVFLSAMAGCALLGFVIERFAYRPLREKPRLTALITAIGISFALSYGFQLDAQVTVAGHTLTLLPGASSRRFPEIIHAVQWFEVGSGDSSVVIWNWQVISFGIAVSLMAALQFLVYRTRFGKAMRAVSHDHRVAALMGIPVDRIIALTFMLGSALAAGAGILYAIKDKAIQPLMGVMVGLKAFVAAVIGGIGNLPGAVVGALTLGLAEEFIVAYGHEGIALLTFDAVKLSSLSGWRDAVAFAFLILVLLFRPAGLFGRSATEKV